MSYSKAAKLINYLEAYEKENGSTSLQDFGKWLAFHGDSDDLVDKKTEKKEHYSNKWNSYEEGLRSQHSHRADVVQIGILIGRLAKYARLYAKRSLNALQLNLDEFTFLASIFHLVEPKKSDIIHLNLMEPTSGTEILRRLINLNYIKEYLNKDDKRSKLVKITPKGQKVILKAFSLMGNVGTLVSANLSEKQKKEVIAIMTYLNEFHVDLYLNNREDKVEEMIAKYIK